MALTVENDVSFDRRESFSIPGREKEAVALTGGRENSEWNYLP